MTWVLWNLVSVCLETVLLSVQDRCTVCAKHTRGSEIVLDTVMDSYVSRLKWMLVSFFLEIVPSLTQDRCMVCAEHTIGSEIVLDTPDGTPRCEAQVEARSQPVWK